jgi:branched-chain amino acid transport system ATP-binding protein
VGVILETKNVSHDFHGLQALFEVDLAVEEGERLAIIGPNGAGKTTLFNVVTGKYQPRRGEVFLNGQRITGKSVPWRARRGLARSFQITNVFPRLTVFESVRAAVLSRRNRRLNCLTPLGRMGPINQEVAEVLDRIGLSDQAGTPAEALAYGQQRGLEIGLTLALRPRVILLDEPTSGMTRDESLQVVELIKRVTEDMTVVIIEHDMDVVFDLADRITVLHYGSVLATGPQAEIRNDPRVKEAYLGEEG